MRNRALIVGCLSVATLAIACSSKPSDSGFGPSGGSSGSNASSGSGGSSSGSAGSSSGGGSSGIFSDASASGSGEGGTCSSSSPNDDQDNDGWTVAQGDCNDCDPMVNPGAIDVLHQVDGGTPTWGDEDCDGTPGDSAKPCDTGLALDDTNPASGAKAIELCRTAAATDRKYGVISANYVRANGAAFTNDSGATNPGLQVGIESQWGTKPVTVQGGANMLVLSNGHARYVNQPGACNSQSCMSNKTATAPTGFPDNLASCPPVTGIFDDVALELKIRVPSNATGYSYAFKFYSFEFPNYVCNKNGWDDQFVTLVSPPPQGAHVPSGSSFGNISFDAKGNPVSVNIGFFDACDGNTSRFASGCTTGCPSPPTPYCPLGTADLQGTGFDVWSPGDCGGTTPCYEGATRWLVTKAPAQPSKGPSVANGDSIITVRFAIWDSGNQAWDSTVLVDDFQWNATAGTPLPPPPVGTSPIQ